MKRIFGFIFLFCIACNGLFAQTRDTTDSLQYRLANAKDDTSRIKAQLALCLAYRLGNTDYSLLYGNRAMEEAVKIGYVPGQILALGLMCIVTEQRGNLPKSLELGFKSLRLGREHNLENLTGPALDGIAETYIVLNDFSRTIDYLRKSILITENTLNYEGLGYSYYDMGVVFAGLKQLDSANVYEEKAIRTFAKYNHEEPLVYLTIGDIKMKSGKLEESLNYYQKSLQIALKNNELRAAADAYNKLATFYKDAIQDDSAVYYAKRGLEEAKLINQKKTILETATLLSQLFEAKDTKLSLDYLKVADAYKDSIFGSGNIEAVQVLATHEEQRQKEQEAEKTAYQNQLRQYALIVGLLALLLIAVFFYRNSRTEKKAKQLLQNKNAIIEQTLAHLKSTQAQLIQSEKMASLGELTAGIAHEIQNPLNFVNNFSEVNNELIEELKSHLTSDEAKLKSKEQDEILNDIFQNNEKIAYHGKRADVIVKGMLQHSRASSGQRELTDINALCDEYLRLAYHGLRAKDKSFNAKFETDLDTSLPKINVVSQDIGRVIINLISNAFYAVSEKQRMVSAGYEPTVIITTKGMGDKVEIRVIDNGNGIPQNVVGKIFQPFFTTKPTGQGTGLGLSLSYDIVKAHGGEMNVETKDREGTQFVIRLPLSLGYK
ncbi:MAG TPA: ATP-binding protein [Chitinophagaceae bacterium]